MNNREIASVFWILVAVLVALIKVPGFARQLASLFRNLVSPRLFLPLTVTGVYMVVLIHAAGRVGLWSAGLLTDAVAWTLLTGAGLFVAAPMIVALGMYLAYDRAFSLVRWATKERRRRWRAGFALVSGLHVHAHEILAIDAAWCRKLVAAGSFADARRVVRQFRAAHPAVPG